MKQKLVRIFLGTLAIIGSYFIVGIILNSYIFPEKKPDLAAYFQPGDVLHSSAEGCDQTIVSQKDGWVHTRVLVYPKAAGPPVHIHTNLVETFAVKEGVLSLLYNGEKKTLRGGESLTIPTGTAHKFFNETDQPVLVESDEIEKTLTVDFAYYLSQLYPFIDNMGENPSTLAVIMQFAAFGNEMDAYLADGPPIPVQKATRILLAPTARLLGYKSYYPEYRTVHTAVK